MYVSPSCHIVLMVFKYSVTDDDVRNIETCHINLLKNQEGKKCIE